MMKDTKTIQELVHEKMSETWTSFLQRRVMHLLLALDPQLFHGQFHVLYAGSSLANHPLLQFYDRYMKFITLGKDLFDDILPRIYLEWNQVTEQSIAQDTNPIRGQIDWPQTLKRASNETPGQLPLRFTIRLRQQQSALPENILVVATLSCYQQFISDTLRIDQQEEVLTNQERQFLVNLGDHLDRELTKPHVGLLLEKAQASNPDTLIEQIHLHPGPSAYRDLLEWWEAFSELQIGSSRANFRLSLSHTSLHDEQMNIWLYELWIVLELITLLQKQNALESNTLRIAIDQLSFTFTWNKKRYLFRYQRRGMMGSAITHDWTQIPAIQSSYLIERENPLIVEYKGKQSWKEPPVVIDTTYNSDTGEAIQRLLGNMAIYTTATGMLISPYVSDPQPGSHVSGEAHYESEKYSDRTQEARIKLYQITPDIPDPLLQARLIAILQQIVTNLPERQQPVCCGMMLNQDSSNASGRTIQEYNVLCPKPHIGSHVYDLVNRERHCLQDPRLCHVIGQVIIPPQANSIVNLNDLQLNIEQLRRHTETILRQSEKENDEERAEQFRSLILQRVGESIEQYVHDHGNTISQEKFLREGIFRSYWDQHACCLESETRFILISGEYVWDEYQRSQLDDWAAPAVQYCRALEREIKRRFYTPIQTEYEIKDKSWTLGSIKNMYNGGKPSINSRNWQAFIGRARTFQITEDILSQQFVTPMVMEKKISDLRNQLAHGDHIDRDTAKTLRNAILGVNGASGLLKWIVKNIGP
ncbi:hypothetical protein [Ktedonobacter racemifer]|uniref:Uncharacterized protein n=1 Tax=Ktedonobacter racemifer DSM 44963 TaxID=485913 RepID=D6TX25_KTERA|nr:hypothetical protein [Ktedonobacter racemifer]EFH84758.1 hypothetical protein Krac_5862 [Ktedonobacter racemifer DSM 44963]